MATIDDIKRDVEEIKSTLEEIKKLLAPASPSAGTPLVPPSGTYFRVNADMIAPQVHEAMAHPARSFIIVPLPEKER